MQDVFAGLILLAIAGVAGWQGSDLPIGTLGHMGPGMLPRALAAAIGLIGAVILVRAVGRSGAAIGRWPIRGTLFVLGAAIAFGLAVRPLGLAVAGPLAVFVGALASRETRWVEVTVFGLAMTVFCVVLFKLLLSLPIPLAPWLIGY